MIEIRFHGRGGQGAVIASKLLAVAFFKDGRFVQSFPSFGVERRGAPVQAFTRMADEYIRVRSQIYTPDHVIVLDRTLLTTQDVTSGLKEGGWIIVNSPEPPENISFAARFPVATVDADGIAVECGLGTRMSPIANTPMLGAFAGATNLVKLDSVLEAVTEYFPKDEGRNAEAARWAAGAIRAATQLKKQIKK